MYRIKAYLYASIDIIMRLMLSYQLLRVERQIEKVPSKFQWVDCFLDGKLKPWGAAPNPALAVWQWVGI